MANFFIYKHIYVFKFLVNDALTENREKSLNDASTH